MNQIKKISVVGAGTAGFVAALILKRRFPTIEVNIIRSKRIGIIGVGEGSTEHWLQFMNYIDVNFQQVISECDATIKAGILFRNWGVDDYMHSVGDENNIYNGQYRTVYAKYIVEDKPNHYMNPSLSWESKLFAKDLVWNSIPYNQYHFNTYKLNAFLEKITAQNNIQIIDDEIVEVNVNEKNHISALIGENNIYSADFFIDCTGFARILMNKLGAKWKSYKEFLTVKAAITFPTPSTNELTMYTESNAMDSGWMFRIPVWDRYGNGYIYDSDFITKEKAEQEVRKLFDHDIEISKEFKFDPGALDRVWINNCCAIGLSSSFFEPLEASSIGSSIQQMFLLMHKIPNYDDKTIEEYNQSVNNIFTNIRDFIVLHYLGKRTDTEYWKSVSNMKLPDTLAYNLEKWRTRLPINEDFTRCNSSDYLLFRPSNFIQVLHGLKLFDRKSIENEYNMMHEPSKRIASEFLRNKLFSEAVLPTISHREYLTRIRMMQNLSTSVVL